MFNSPWLLRHGAPLERGFCYGHSDPTLIEPAQQTAQRLRHLLPAWRRLFSSDSPRCLALAQTFDSATIAVAELRELNFGDWEGRPWDSIRRADLDAWAQQPLDFVMPGGESGRDLYRRVARWAASVQPGRDDLIVAHAGSLRALAAVLLQRPFDDCWQWPLAYANCVRLEPGIAGFVSDDTA